VHLVVQHNLEIWHTQKTATTPFSDH